MPKIPVDVISLPTEFEPLDETISYHTVCRSCKISDDTDKNGNYFLTGIKLEILEPEEWRGRSVYANYICIPQAPESGSSLADRRRNDENGVALARFIKAFKIPYDAEGIDPDDAVGCEGDVSARNEEYQGRKIPRVQDFLL